jgi:hypothetical protein
MDIDRQFALVGDERIDRRDRFEVHVTRHSFVVAVANAPSIASA